MKALEAEFQGFHNFAASLSTGKQELNLDFSSFLNSRKSCIATLVNWRKMNT